MPDLWLPWIETIEALTEPLNTTMDQLQDTYGTYREETALMAKCVADMSRVVRDFLAVLTRRVAREEQPEYLISYYTAPGQSLAGKKSAEEWYHLGRLIIAGEAKALTKGFPAMVNPSVADVVDCLDAFKQRYATAEPSDRNYQEVQLKMKELRGRAQLAARGLAATLRVLLSGEEPSGKRRAMRGYGFRFRDEPAPPVVLQPPLEPNQEALPNSPGDDDTQNSPVQATEPDPPGKVFPKNISPHTPSKREPVQLEGVQVEGVRGYDHRWIMSPKRAQAG
jgi:hypothetical protein